ncbi:MAG: hypothetical protein ABR542_10660, partial [Desulfonatronovibrio sp.]
MKSAGLKKRTNGFDLNEGRTDTQSQELLVTEAAFNEFYHPALYWPMFRASILSRAKKGLQQTLGQGL